MKWFKFLITLFEKKNQQKLFSLIKVKWPLFKILITSAILHFFGIIVASFGSLFYNIIGIMNSNKENSHYVLNVFMIIFGSICILASIGFLLYFRFKILYLQKVEPNKTNQTANVQTRNQISTNTNRLNENQMTEFNSISNPNSELPYENDIYYSNVDGPYLYELPPSYNSINEQTTKTWFLFLKYKVLKENLILYIYNFNLNYLIYNILFIKDVKDILRIKKVNKT